MDKAEAFRFFRLLANLDPVVAEAERLKFDGHIDYFLPSVPVACVREGVRVGNAEVEVLSLREPPS